MKFQNLISVLLLLLICVCYGCKDDDECRCSTNFSALEFDENCNCLSDQYFQVGNFTTECDEEQEIGICVERNANTFMMTNDCNCSPLTAYDSTIVEMSVSLHYINKRTRASATGGVPGIYTEMSDGNEFEYKQILPGFENAIDECTGGYFGLQGFMKGKFNEDNNFCETKIYWRFGETGEDRDSCTVTFRK